MLHNRKALERLIKEMINTLLSFGRDKKEKEYE
jgi:hypothetical protein